MKTIFLHLLHAERSHDLAEAVFSWKQCFLYSIDTAFRLGAFWTAWHGNSSRDLASLLDGRKVFQCGLNILALPLSPFIMRYGRQSLGIIWIPNAFSSNPLSTIHQVLEYHWIQLLSKKELQLEVARVHIGECVIMWKTFDLNDQRALFSKDECQNS